MFGMRRYRLFLFVAVLSAATIYWLSSRGSWYISDLEGIGKTNFKHVSPQKPSLPDKVVEPILPPPPADNILKPVETLASKINSRILSQPSSSIEADLASTSTEKPSVPTVTGQGLLHNGETYQDEITQEGSGRLEEASSPTDGRKPRWRKPEAHFPLAAQQIITLPSGAPKKLPKIQATSAKETSSTRTDRLSKLNTIKESFKHAWNGYKQYGMPHDEIKPISKSYQDPFMGWGATLVDTLDTLWIMNLNPEFEEALAEIGNIDFTTSMRKDLPLFETVIRYLGGLLAAYDVSEAKYPILLEKAEELAEILMGAFDTPNRMPVTFYHWAPSYTSQPHRANAHAVMAELGSLSIEMTRLAQITKKHDYYDAIARITNELEKWQPNTLIAGLWPLKIDASGCRKADHTLLGDDEDGLVEAPVLLGEDNYENAHDESATKLARVKSKEDDDSRSISVKRGATAEMEATRQEKRRPPLRQMDQEVLAVECTPQGLTAEPNAKYQTFGIGGQADSTYEYLPKMHALLRGRNKQYESMYLDSAQAIREHLLFRPMIKDEKRQILFASKHDMNPKAKVTKKKDIVTYEVTHLSCFLGGMFALGAKLFGIDDDLELAKQLTDGCVWAYESMPTGVMAESAAVVPCPDLEACTWNETKWQEALDPQLDERLAAVEAWNKNQKAIYEKSRAAALRDAGSDQEPRPTASTAENETRPRKREVTDEKASRTSSNLDFEDDDEKSTNLDDASSTIRFVPKTALSHDKYVKARITEERLPASYTKIFARHYGLRPEAIESVFYMYRITGDNIWRQKGWQMFEAVQSATQTEVANAAMKDVTSNLGELEDTMESFWLAETLKYFYLLFDEPENWSLDEYVLNTEAHLLRIPP